MNELDLAKYCVNERSKGHDFGLSKAQFVWSMDMLTSDFNDFTKLEGTLAPSFAKNDVAKLYEGSLLRKANVMFDRQDLHF